MLRGRRTISSSRFSLRVFISSLSFFILSYFSSRYACRPIHTPQAMSETATHPPSHRRHHRIRYNTNPSSPSSSPPPQELALSRTSRPGCSALQTARTLALEPHVLCLLPPHQPSLRPTYHLPAAAGPPPHGGRPHRGDASSHTLSLHVSLCPTFMRSAFSLAAASALPRRDAMASSHASRRSNRTASPPLPRAPWSAVCGTYVGNHALFSGPLPPHLE